MSQLCGTCKHWGKPDRANERFRQCARIQDAGDNLCSPDIVEELRLSKTRELAHCETEECRRMRRVELEYIEEWAGRVAVFRGNEKAAAAASYDDSDSWLMTRDDFGCVLWEPKGETDGAA